MSRLEKSRNNFYKFVTITKEGACKLKGFNYQIGDEEEIILVNEQFFGDDKEHFIDMYFYDGFAI